MSQEVRTETEIGGGPPALISAPRALDATICFSITHGFQARNLLQTDVLPLLVGAGYRVLIVAPAADDSGFHATFGRPGVSFRSAHAKPGPLSNFFAAVRRYALADPRRNATYNLFNEKYLKSRKPTYVVLRALNKVVGRHRLLRDGWMSIESLLISGRELEWVFEPTQPVLLVTGTPGTIHLDTLLLRCARRVGVPSVCVVLSWDNLTSKGYMAARPDRLVVWNERMRQEAVELHDYDPDAVVVAGVAHFDVYARPHALFSREEVCGRLRLDPGRPILVFGTVSPFLFPYNHEIGEILARAIADGRIVPRAQVVIRLHPQAVGGGAYSDSLEAYHLLQRRFREDVALDVPQLVSSGLQWAMPNDEMVWLASLLTQADVCLNAASTLTIDAALCDTPIIGIAFDGYHELPYSRSIRRAYDYTHYAPIVASGGLQLAESKDSLVKLVNRYLADRSLDRAGRAQIVREQAWRLDGRSGERVAAAIATFADGMASKR